MKIRQLLSDCSCALPLAAALAAARGRGGGCGRVWSSGHARAVAETAGCRLGRRRSRRRPRLQLRRRARAPLIDRQFEVSALSGGSVGRLCGSGGRVWSGDRSPSLVCVFSGRLCVLGSGFRWFPKQDFCVSRNFFTSGGQSAAVFVRVCQHGSFVKSIPCSLVPFSRSISIWLA